MVWSLALDDFAKMCKSSSRPFPLISTIRDELMEAEKGHTGKPTTTFTTGTRTSKSSTTPPTTTTTTTTSPLPPYPDDGRLWLYQSWKSQNSTTVVEFTMVVEFRNQ